jgi:hypothetical protein
MADLGKGLFIYPYRTDPWIQFGKLPPIGLEIVAASVKDIFSSIDIVDMRFENDLIKHLEGTDVVCLSLPWGRDKGVAGGISKGYDVDYIYKLIRKIPDNITIAIGGTFASESADYLLKNFPNIDIIVNGQGEETLREFLTSGSTRNIDGISYRNNGNVIRAKEREPNIIPFLYPDRKLRKYKYNLFGNRIDCIYTSHGCPHRCVYCEFEGSKWNNRSAEDIFQEIREMDKDVKFILINDNNFLENTQRADKFLDLLKEHKIRKTFWAQARSQPLAKRKDLVAKLSAAGFILAIGVESPQEHVLKWLKKGFMRNINDEAFENMKRTSLVIQAYYIIGNYKETREEILDITDYSHDNWIDFICLNRLRCYPQSQLAGMIEKLDGIYVDKSDLRVYTDEVQKKELTKLCKIIVNDFYLSKTILRTLCKLSFIMNVPIVVRYFICSLFNLYVFKRNRKMINFTDALFRFNILLPLDLLLNYFLRLLGRLIYGIRPG